MMIHGDTYELQQLESTLDDLTQVKVIFQEKGEAKSHGLYGSSRISRKFFKFN
jgi:hypothetical protein